MTFSDFINQNNNKGLDFDGYYGDQCVDLAQFYNRDVLGNPKRFTGNAADIFGQQPDFFNSTPNTPTGVPLSGDIVIWGGALNNGPGHIAVFVSGDPNSFTSFDQNWPTGSPCHLQKHNYNYVVGWLHPKKGNSDMLTPSELDKVVKMGLQREPRPDELNNVDWENSAKLLIDTVWGNGGEDNYKKSQVAQQQITNLTTQVKDLQSQLATQSGDSVQLNALGVALQWLLKRLGLK